MPPVPRPPPLEGGELSGGIWPLVLVLSLPGGFRDGGEEGGDEAGVGGGGDVLIIGEGGDLGGD